MPVARCQVKWEIIDEEAGTKTIKVGRWARLAERRAAVVRVLARATAGPGLGKTLGSRGLTLHLDRSPSCSGGPPRC